MKRNLYNFCRYTVAFIIITYGWSKIMGSQFSVLESELDKPLGEVSGFWLTWYYFSFSSVYGSIIAIVQIISGFLLLYRKTVLLAALVLFGMVGNVVLIDIFFRIDLGALVMAIILEAALLIILYFHRDELIELFWVRQNSLFPNTKRNSFSRVIKIFLIVFITLVPPFLTYYISNNNNRYPTEIDGKWKVLNVSTQINDGTEPLSKIYFEYNRAFMSVFRFGNNKWVTHHFEVLPESRQIKIWQNWLRKGDIIFAGHYELKGEKLYLKGHYQFINQPVVIEMHKQL